MKKKIQLVCVVAALVASVSTVKAESPVTFSASADLVSSYVWRGLYTTGVAIQPGASVSAYGLTLGAWGSTDFTSPAKEFDLSLGYEVAGFSVGITDYWWNGQGAGASSGTSYYKKYKNSHFLEGTVGYSFGESFPLSISWSTMFFGDGDKNFEGKQRYSSYLALGYDWDIKWGVLTFGLGLTPFTNGTDVSGHTTLWGNTKGGFNVTDVSVKGAKTFDFKSGLSLSLFAQPIWAPATSDVHLVGGVSVAY